LPKNGRDLEHVSAERRDKNPIKETEVELEVVLQKKAISTIENAKRAEIAKAKLTKQVIGREADSFPYRRFGRFDHD
jgi:hypothetical protein